MKRLINIINSLTIKNNVEYVGMVIYLHTPQTKTIGPFRGQERRTSSFINAHISEWAERFINENGGARNLKCIYHFHSHPGKNPLPSVADLMSYDHYRRCGLKFAGCIVTDNLMAMYTPKKHGISGLKGELEELITSMRTARRNKDKTELFNAMMSYLDVINPHFDIKFIDINKWEKINKRTAVKIMVDKLL